MTAISLEVEVLLILYLYYASICKQSSLPPGTFQ